MITVNGKTYEGNSVSMINGKVYIDGKEATDVDESKTTKTVIVCGPNTVFSDFTCNDLTVNGDINGPVYAKGSVSANNIAGDVKSGGSVNCDGVSGNVTAGGSVNCDSVGGSVIAGGSVNR